ncbi:MAG: PEGA domain-containing protein [Armatimonadetes bacterium]|nr:PEGA domain-containing protein [Armatimonadota bacterium]
MSIIVIVAYVLGLGTGVVGGVVFSFNEFAAPVVAVTPSPQATVAGTPSPSVAASESPLAVDSPSPTESVSPSPTVAASASPSGIAVDSPSPTSASPSAVAQETPTASPSPTPSPTPSPSPTPKKPSTATLVVNDNKGSGFKVYVDGEMKGKTPLSVEVAADKPHQIKVIGGERYTTWEGKVTPGPGEKREIVATLSYIPPPPPPVYRAPEPYNPPAYNPPPSYGGGRPSVQGQQRF